MLKNFARQTSLGYAGEKESMQTGSVQHLPKKSPLLLDLGLHVSITPFSFFRQMGIWDFEEAHKQGPCETNIL